MKPGADRTGPGVAALVAVAMLEVAWFAWFAFEPLPNVGAVAGGRGLCRMNLWIRALPEVVPDVGFRESYLGTALGNLAHFENLPQRLPILLAAGFIAASALAAGSLILRALGLRGALDRWERLALGYGLGASALGVSALILGRLGVLHPWPTRAGLALPIAAEVLVRVLGRPGAAPGGAWPGRWSAIGFGAVAGPFLVLMLLGSMLPCTDFDALEYHLQGPKEYYLAGRVSFLPHNVYTSMPFNVEMLHLIGMEVVDDWWIGALVGQVVVAGFAPASAVLVALAARRLGSPRAAWVAGVVYLSTPWVYRVAVLPYVEGPLCTFHAALVWAWARDREPRGDGRFAALVGLVAGSAMGIKYPGLVSAVIPASAWAAAVAWRARSWRPLAGFAAGVLVAVGPWLAKNVVDTGNPVYPLGYSVFGGRDWSPERDRQWSAVHGPRPIEATAFARSVVEVAGRSDWQSPLYLALVPLALFGSGWRAARWPAIYAVYLFLTWWLLTHRLDRFWLPILPPLAVLAGLGVGGLRSRAWVALAAAAMAAGVGANLVYCSTELAGLNDWTGDLRALRRSVPELLNPPLAKFDRELPPGARPLLVGQAAVFFLEHPPLYNTVFDDDLFEGLARGKSPDEVRSALNRLGVTHIYVDWSEINRYRSPGNYGFTPFVTREVFARMVEGGALGPPSRSGLGIDEVYGVGPGPAR